jgi:hypothetical protein
LVIAAMPLLWLLGVCLFLPAIAIATPQLSSPAAGLWMAPLPVAALLAPLLLAPLLMVLTLVPLLSGRVPGRRGGQAATAVVLATLGSPLWVATLESMEQSGCLHGYDLALCFYVAVPFLALLVLALGHRVDGWRRHQYRLAAFALASLPLAMFTARVMEDEQTGPACWLLVPASLLLALITVPTLRAIKRR